MRGSAQNPSPWLGAGAGSLLTTWDTSTPHVLQEAVRLSPPGHVAWPPLNPVGFPCAYDP